MKTNADVEAVLTAAENEATSLKSNFIGTEHLLLGIVLRPECTAMVVLKKTGLGAIQILQQLETRVSPASVDSGKCGRLPLTPRTKGIMKLAEKEAADLGSHELTSAHILLGILRHDDGVAAQVLRECNIPDIQSVREIVRLSVAIYSKTPEKGISTPNKPAKDFVHEFSEIGRHDDYGNRHNFMSLIFAGVNVSASLNDLQQNLCEKRISEAWIEVREKSEGDKAKEAMNIAAFINTCHP